jgi:hypothetical protein
MLVKPWRYCVVCAENDLCSHSAHRPRDGLESSDNELGNALHVLYDLGMVSVWYSRRASVRGMGFCA